MTRSFVGRADLLRLAATASDDDLRRLAELAGFRTDPSYVHQEDDPAGHKPPPAFKKWSNRLEKKAIGLAPLRGTPFFHASRFKPEPLNEIQEVGPQRIYGGWRERPNVQAGFQPLLTWAELVPILRELLALPAPTRRVDVARTVDRIARSDTLERLPMRSRLTWPRKLVVVIDRSTHLVPFWQDQDLLVAALVKFLPHATIELLSFDDQYGRFMRRGRALASAKDIPALAPDVLVLGDLGALAQSESGRRAWQRLGEAISPGRARVLSPVPVSWLPKPTVKVWRARPWSRTISSRSKAQQDADDLLSLLSPLVRIEPNLLRQVRLKAFPRSGPEVEALAWRHGAMGIRLEDAGQLRPQAMQRRRAGFGEIDEPARQALVDVWRSFRGDLHEAVYFEELLELDPETRALLPESDVEDAEAFFASMARQVTQGSEDHDIQLWCGRIADRFLRLKDNPDAATLIWQAKRDDPTFAGLDPGTVPVKDQPPVPYRVIMSGDGLLITSDMQGKGSTIGLIPSCDGLVRVDVADAEDTVNGLRVIAPVRLAGGGMTPEMIEVPAGSFLMGSPPTEEGRYDDEGPQQRITFEEPFALARYPVTFEEYDAFCDATGREKPGDSGWGRGRKPVINVSWNDAKAYCDWLSAETGEDYHLPSEAAWEYACRAGTQTRYHWGDEWSSDKANGVGSRGGTTDVGGYDPNAWGFHDMHGNVREWCADFWNGRHEGAAPDGSARQVSQQASESSRVLRGGSWYDYAGDCRSAYRGRCAPGYRGDFIGFRPARGQATGAQAGGNAERSGAGGGKAGVAEPPAGRSPRPTSGRRPGVESRPLKRVRVLPGREATLDLRDLPDAPFVIRTDRAELVIQRTTLSGLGWASGMGRDRFGLWAEFALDDLRPRLRYCPPGRFTMGSPEDEPGRDDDEGPLTEITFETGFWMFETPVTQDLYAAVMRDVKDADPEPSRFKSPRRPVDTVSWIDARDFIEAINTRLPNLDLHLPSEAAWEYACRAGTQTATYAGPITILGKNNAPVLDEIAWYGGNSGKDFDLENGHDSSSWDEKQYPHIRAGTREVGLKRPNAWGMLDMLGNVYEWCDDVWKNNHEGAAADGAAWQVSQQASETRRVLRGGSWNGFAGDCRSACRLWFAPGFRDVRIGFRPARGQQGAQAGANAERSLPGGGKAGVAEPPAGHSPESSRQRRDDSIPNHPRKGDS